MDLLPVFLVIETIFSTLLVAAISTIALAAACCALRVACGRGDERFEGWMEMTWTLVPLALLVLLWVTVVPSGHA